MNKTKIEYLTHTWNPIAMRCTPVSEACENCWHLRAADRLSENPKIPMEICAIYRGDKPPKIIPYRLMDLVHKKDPCMIGVQFMGDLWLNGVGWENIDKIFDACCMADRHAYLFLTKRIRAAWYYFNSPIYGRKTGRSTYLKNKNIWVGVTVENQERAGERIPLLFQIPAKIRFISAEPILGPIDLDETCGITWCWRRDLDWVICGAETGPKARPMDLSWARDLRDQCKSTGTPFFFKSAGNKQPIPHDLLIREYPFQAQGQEEV